jgi:hypothetical protein
MDFTRSEIIQFKPNYVTIKKDSPTHANLIKDGYKDLVHAVKKLDHGDSVCTIKIVITGTNITKWVANGSIQELHKECPSGIDGSLNLSQKTCKNHEYIPLFNFCSCKHCGKPQESFPLNKGTGSI